MVPMFGDIYPLLPVMGVLTRIFMLMHSLHHFHSTILLPWYIVTAYHTTTSLLLAGAILLIDIATIRLAICVPHVLR